MKAELAERDAEPLAVQDNPSALIALGMRQNVPVETLTKLIELKERMDAAEAKRAFVEALSAFKESPPKIIKNATVDFTSQKGRTHYRHASLDHACAQLDTALAKHGLSFRWRTAQLDGGIVRVTCILTHSMGHSEETSLQSLPDASGSKNPIQAVGSAVTYLQRYTLLTATGMAVQGADDDGRAAGQADEPLTAAQLKQVVDGLNETKADWDAFLKFFRLADVSDMTQSDFPRAMEMISRKRANKKG